MSLAAPDDRLQPGVANFSTYQNPLDDDMTHSIFTRGGLRTRSQRTSSVSNTPFSNSRDGETDTLFIGNLSSDMTEAGIRRMVPWQSSTGVSRIQIVPRHATGTAHCYITFSDIWSARAARISIIAGQLSSRALEVRFAQPHEVYELGPRLQPNSVFDAPDKSTKEPWKSPYRPPLEVRGLSAAAQAGKQKHDLMYILDAKD